MTNEWNTLNKDVEKSYLKNFNILFYYFQVAISKNFQCNERGKYTYIIYNISEVVVIGVLSVANDTTTHMGGLVVYHFKVYLSCSRYVFTERSRKKNKKVNYKQVYHSSKGKVKVILYSICSKTPPLKPVGNAYSFAKKNEWIFRVFKKRVLYLLAYIYIYIYLTISIMNWAY